MEQAVSSRVGAASTTAEHFRPGIDDVVILPLVAAALLIRTVLRAALNLLIRLLDFLFPILLQLMRFPLFTLRLIGDGLAALLRGLVRILPIGGNRQAAWREYISQYWAWLRQKFSYHAFEEAVHRLFESGMA